MSILVIAEHDNNKMSPVTRSCVGAAKQLGDELHLVVVGYQCDSVVIEASHLEGVSTVFQFQHETCKNQLAESVVDVLVPLAKDYDYVLASASTFGKNILPRLAALLDVGQISDISHILTKDTFVRPIYAGNVLETVQSLDSIKVITIRPTAFDKAEDKSDPAPTKSLSFQIGPLKSNYIKTIKSDGKRPDLTQARVVVSGGRALKSAENFKMLETLADALDGAVGASRAAVDAGFVPNDYQVGQTGKVVAPDLYIAIGISGAVQHIAGMKDSKVIVAINKDKDAPIFKFAHYGLVGDLFQIVPELINELKGK